MKRMVLSQATLGKFSKVVGTFEYDPSADLITYIPNGADKPVPNDQFLVMWGNAYMVPKIKGFVTLQNPKHYFERLPERFRGRLFISSVE